MEQKEVSSISYFNYNKKYFIIFNYITINILDI